LHCCYLTRQYSDLQLENTWESTATATTAHTTVDAVSTPALVTDSESGDEMFPAELLAPHCQQIVHPMRIESDNESGDDDTSMTAPVNGETVMDSPVPDAALLLPVNSGAPTEMSEVIPAADN
jgi:hypothetical protein